MNASHQSVWNHIHDRAPRIGGRFRLHGDVPFLHANLGNIEDWPMKFTGTEEHTPGSAACSTSCRTKWNRRTPAGALQSQGDPR
jgi:hypothetical protein